MNRWLPIDTAPTDGTTVRVRTNSVQGLPVFEIWASYYPDAGWCVDELREVIEWSPGWRDFSLRFLTREEQRVMDRAVRRSFVMLD